MDFGFLCALFSTYFAKLFSRPQLFQVLSCAMHLSECPGSHGAPQFEQNSGGGRLPCLWKLFERIKFEEKVQDRQLEKCGNTLAVTPEQS